MSNVTVNGIVISSMPIGEYDRRLEILTSDYGRISVFATGARKPSSELVAVSRVFALGVFELYQGKSAYNLRHAKISDYFTELSQNIELTYYGFYFLEQCRYFSRENVEAGEMLNLLYFSLKALERPNIDNRLIRAVFELKMLDINGICPQYRRITDPSDRFSIGEDLDDSTKYAIGYVLSNAPGKLYKFALTENVLSQFISVVSHLVNILIGKKFKSTEFLDL